MKQKLLAIPLALLLLIFATHVKAQSASESYLTKIKLLKDMEGKPSPSFEAVTVSGKKVSAESLKGKIVVVNFWFVGCPPCHEEIPLLNRLENEYQDNKNVVFLSFSRSTTSDTKNFLTKNKFDYETVADAKNIANNFNVSGYPSHFIIDEKGILRFASIGASDDIEKVLGQKLKSIMNNTTNSSSKEKQGSVRGTNTFKNEEDELVDTQEAVKMMAAGTHRAFKEHDKDGKEYYRLKKTN